MSVRALRWFFPGILLLALALTVVVIDREEDGGVSSMLRPSARSHERYSADIEEISVQGRSQALPSSGAEVAAVKSPIGLWDADDEWSSESDRTAFFASGRVVDPEGEPIADLPVELVDIEVLPGESDCQVEAVFTDDEGRFDFWGRIGRSTTVLKFSVSVEDSFRTAKKEGLFLGSTGIEIVFHRRSLVHFAVFDRSTDEALKAICHIIPKEGHPMRLPLFPNADGIASVSLPVGMHRVCIGAQELGFPDQAFKDFRVLRSQPEKPIRVGLSRGAIVNLKVLVEEGRIPFFHEVALVPEQGCASWSLGSLDANTGEAEIIGVGMGRHALRFVSSNGPLFTKVEVFEPLSVEITEKGSRHFVVKCRYKDEILGEDRH